MTENNYAERDLLVRGIAAAKAGETQEARFFLEWYLGQNPPITERNNALFYLSQITDNQSDRRKLLETMLDNDPFDIRARRELAILDGALPVDQVIDPDKLPEQQPDEVSNQSADRFICPKCGGRMTYTPDGHSLTCEYCETRTQHQAGAGAVRDENFIVALATAKGHSQAVNTQVIHCQGCNAEFIVPPRQLTWQCPYCQSNYKIEQVESHPIILPLSLIPFYVSPREAGNLIHAWSEENDNSPHPQVSALQGIYIPAWTFDVGGNISWVLEVLENKEWKPRKDQKSIFHDDILVAATRMWPQWMNVLLDSYDLSQLVPFDYEYLANWVAETYQINAGDAALRARETTLQRERKVIQDYSLQTVRNITINSTWMTVEQYKLILLPVWSGLITLGQIQVQILINGQTGKFISPPPRPKGLGAWFTNLFG